VIGTGPGSHHGSHPSRLLNTAQPVAGVNTLGHGIINAAAALSYAKTHRHPGVAQDFAPRWYRATEFTLLAAVIVKYSWALIQMLRRRSAGPLAATVDLAVNVAG
jgi:hypothetical protein